MVQLDKEVVDIPTCRCSGQGVKQTSLYIQVLCKVCGGQVQPVLTIPDKTGVRFYYAEDYL